MGSPGQGTDRPKQLRREQRGRTSRHRDRQRRLDRRPVDAPHRAMRFGTNRQLLDWYPRHRIACKVVLGPFTTPPHVPARIAAQGATRSYRVLADHRPGHDCHCRLASAPPRRRRPCRSQSARPDCHGARIPGPPWRHGPHPCDGNDCCKSGFSSGGTGRRSGSFGTISSGGTSSSILSTKTSR